MVEGGGWEPERVLGRFPRSSKERLHTMKRTSSKIGVLALAAAAVTAGCTKESESVAAD